MTRAFLSAVLMLGIGVATFGQTHLGSIRVTVFDPTGAVVPNAPLRLIDDGTNLTRAATSGLDGAFSFSQLRPGGYQLEVELAGYKQSVHRATLAVAQRLHLDVMLQIGAMTERVVVSAAEPALDVASVGLGTVIHNDQIEGLPLDGRNFLELARLVPGVTPAAEGSAGTVRGDRTFSSSGGRDDANSYLLDGAYNVDAKLNTVGVRPPVDAIGEFTVLTNGYDASFGRHAGAQINVITRSGTNAVDGTAYGFFRNSAMNARNFFAPPGEPDPEYRRSQYGFSLGGPAIRDRTFFFADYEGTRLSEGITRIANVPTLAERQGDFSQSRLPPPMNPLTGQPFPGNQIPDMFQHPVGRAIANLYPLPNREVAFQNYVASPTQTDDRDHFDIKVDQRLGTASLLTVRYSFGDRRLSAPFSGPGFPTVPGFGFDLARRAQNALLGHTHVLSPRVANDLRVVFNRVASGITQENAGVDLNSQVGLPNLSDNPRTRGLSSISITGFSPLGDEFNNPQDSALTTFQILDTMTWSAGPHLFKVGGDLRFTRQNGFRDVQSRGFLNFSSVPGITGNALADVLLGLPITTGGARLDNPQRLRAQSYNFFVHDNLQIGPTLTLSVGLRYELNLPPVDADDRANLYDPATGVLVPVGTGGLPRGGYETDKNNFAPRLGVAWSPEATGETVVRSGYGIYYDQSSLAPGEGLYFNPPFFDFNLFFPLPGLPLTLTDPFPSNFPFPLPPSALAFQRDLRTPLLQQWHISIQREVGAGRTIEVAYVGSKGTNLVRGRDVNQAGPSPEPFNARPNQQFADIIAIESQASSRYDSLQLRFQQRSLNGLTVLSSYTFGKSRDDASGFFTSTGDPNFPQDSNDPAAEYGRSGFDVRHRFSLSFTYELPFRTTRARAGAEWVSHVLDDWHVAGIVTLQSGQPFTVALLPEFDNSNTGRAALGFGSNDRPNLVGDPVLANPSATTWFNTAAFALPSFGTFGDAGRNILEGPAFKNMNIALLKLVRLGANVRAQVRIEAFNLFNHVNFGLPDNFFGSPSFGQIPSAGNARRVQLGLKLLF